MLPGRTEGLIPEKQFLYPEAEALWSGTCLRFREEPE
jgi:hypothetical protein